jgi:FKBP-type peptidyl-prolyl cis-trans isomerase SlyD
MSRHRNYGFERRRKEEQRRAKQEAKRQRKQERADEGLSGPEMGEPQDTGRAPHLWEWFSPSRGRVTQSQAGTRPETEPPDDWTLLTDVSDEPAGRSDGAGGRQGPPNPIQENPMSRTIANGSTVQIEYTLKDETGAIIDSNEGRAPLTYVHGENQIIPGLEQALSGMAVGQETHVTVPPEDAYGQADPSAVIEVPKHVVPPDALVPGTQLVAQKPGGGTRVVRVHEVREQSVMLDLNHPLAGKTLYFDVKIVAVLPPAQP